MSSVIRDMLGFRYTTYICIQIIYKMFKAAAACTADYLQQVLVSQKVIESIYIYVPAQLAADVKMSNILPISSYICALLHCFLWQSSLQNLAAQESTVNTANTGFTAAWNDVSLVFMRCGIINMHILESNSWILIQFQTICYISFLAQKSAYSSIMQTLKLYLEHKQNGEHQLECYFSCRS